jgi:hypothetical protein
MSLAKKIPESASTHIDQCIEELADWRSETLARMRALILKVDPNITEEWKWNVPVWSCNGIICTGESYKKAVKLTFAKGASVADPTGIFNASLEGNARRAIDIHEGESINARAFKALVKAAVVLNQSKVKTEKVKPDTKTTTPLAKTDKVVLLSGGNPQIAKGDCDAPVQAYLAAMPSWKRELGMRLDSRITAAIPNVRKAVKWNSPFYGIEGKGWCLSFHVFTRYVKVTFFNGTSLKPMPPGATEKSGDTRWLDIYEHDEFDEAQLTKWIKQAAKLPGWDPGSKT